MSQDSWRICVGDATADTCDQSLITDSSNTVRSAVTVQCISGKSFTVTIQLSTSRTVSVTGVDIPGTDIADGSLLRQESLAVFQRVAPSGKFTSDPASLPVQVGPDAKPYGTLANEFRLRYRLVCDPSDWEPGSTVTFDDFRVDYHALGRNRTEDVPLMYALQIQVPDHH